MLTFVFKFDFKWCFSVHSTAMNLDLSALGTFCRFMADTASPKLNSSVVRWKHLKLFLYFLSLLRGDCNICSTLSLTGGDFALMSRWFSLTVVKGSSAAQIHWRMPHFRFTLYLGFFSIQRIEYSSGNSSDMNTFLSLNEHLLFYF